MGCKLHVMTLTPRTEDKTRLPNGLYVLRTYSGMKNRMSPIFMEKQPPILCQDYNCNTPGLDSGVQTEIT